VISANTRIKFKEGINMEIKEIVNSAWHSAKSLSPFKNLEFGAPGKRDYEDIRKVNAALLSLLAVGFVAAIWVGWRACSVGPVLLWCVACLAVGGVVGFLFGIPRSGGEISRTSAPKGTPTNGTTSTPPSAIQGRMTSRPNTNLEEVSDWLTKIIVGLGLVHLRSIEDRVWAVSRNAAAALNATPTAADISAATALIVGFTVMGFLCGYLYTRLFLQGAFIRSDRDMQDYKDIVAQELSNAAPAVELPSGQPSVPSASERQAAERVLQAAPSDRPEEILAPMLALAADYENVRSEMTFGSPRTRKMTEIANRMKPLALVTAPFLPQLTASSSSGIRLAAVIILQMKFDPTYIDWLANRLIEEPAFVGYQAASALLARVCIIGGPERQRIKAAVQAAATKRIDLKLEPEVERDKLVEQILAV
jgi:hypothetical protein